jgi:hypothetical protein
MAADVEVDLHDTCAAAGCDVRVPFGRLMCGPHWARVPKAIQSRVYATWRRRQGAPHDPDRRAAHEEAKRAAILAVAETDGLPTEDVR